MRLIAIFFLLSITASATAAVYKWVQPDGSIIYSDRQPAGNTSPTDLPPVQEIKMPPPPPSPPGSNPSDQADQTQTTAYTKLEITEPTDDSTIAGNAGQISIKLALEPPLDAEQGDMVSIFLDGNEIGQGKSTALTLTNVDRGTHSLQAVVKNAKGSALITSSSITVHLQRVSSLQKKP